MEDVARLDVSEGYMHWEQLSQSESESLYPNEMNTKLEMKDLPFEEPQSDCNSGSATPPTLTNLNDVGYNYITGDANALLAGEDSGFADRYVDCVEPASWDHWQVQSWLQQFSLIDGTAFSDLNGESLCELTLENFMHRDQVNGGMLYNQLQQLLYPQTYPYVPQQPNYHPNFPGEFEATEALTSFDHLLKIYSVTGAEGLPSIPTVKEEKPVVKQECEIDVDVSSPSSPADSEISAISSTKPTGRRNSRGKGKLWEFIRDLLLDTETCPSIIRWENRAEGIFRIVKSDQVAQLWGNRKCNKSMTYEKMSRAMRYYYKKDVLERIECRRLVYKFGNRSRGWQL